MMRRLLGLYKVPLLISFTLFASVVAIRTERNVFTIIFTGVGALLGTFLLDADYLLYAFFVEPNAEFSKNLNAYLKHKDFAGLLSHVYYHKDDIKDKILNSVVFQLILAGASILVLSSNSGIMVKTLVLSAFLNSIYKLIRHIFENRLDLWFWNMREVPQKKTAGLYSVVLMGYFVFCLTYL